jgi:hypothetical protein
MIPKSGNRFSEKIMLKQKISDESGSTQLKQTLVGPILTFASRCGREFLQMLESKTTSNYQVSSGVLNLTFA